MSQSLVAFFKVMKTPGKTATNIYFRHTMPSVLHPVGHAFDRKLRAIQF